MLYSRAVKSLLILPVITFCILISTVSADERILNFHSDITVHEDSSMTVRETIRVRAEGDRIRRGIYRDFPTKYRDHDGRKYHVGFSVMTVLKNGRAEPFHLSGLSNGQRVYIGKKDVTLNPGEYEYVITYRTDHQLGFFEDFDELYWNVTGNGWEFSIDSASADIHLPSDAGGKVINTAAYTGLQGSKGSDFRQDGAGSVIRFSTTRRLGAKEGLTVAVSWPKGYVRKPDGADSSSQKEGGKKTDRMTGQGLGILYAIGGLFILSAYYLIIWYRAGQDPEAGAIVVRYTPPSDMSPAVMRFISKMAYDDKCFASALINMAVRGHLTINEDDGEYLLRKTDADRNLLSPEEDKVFEHLFGSGSEIALKQDNHVRIGNAVKEFKDFLKQKYEKIYFVTNTRYFVLGLLLTALLIFMSGYGVSRSRLEAPAFVFICIWLTIWSAGVIAMVRQMIKKWRLAFSKGMGRLKNGAGALFLTLFSIPFIGGEIAGLTLLGHYSSYMVVFLLVAAMGINYLFFHLLKAPTRAGRAVMDSIDGFRQFIAATEKDRLNFMNPPDRTPKLFEKYLPYALALDLEQNWAEQFTDVLSSVSVEGEPAGYRPVWYHGSNLGSLSSADFAGSVGDAVAGAVSSSSSAPGSSSGSGGGGSSGGGGGGGGGGGW